MRILFIGDVVGKPGRMCVQQWVPRLCEELAIDFVIANGENSAGGLGATPDTLNELLGAGVQLITLGNHTWRKKELARSLESFPNVIRPANFPPDVPGRGSAVVEAASGRRVAVLNLIGRVYMEPQDCPFRLADTAVERLSQEADLVLVDFHAEATAEKVAMGWFLDGRCAAVLGTHTHVQTADERVLPGGTAYISDVGMTGPFDSVIGMERAPILQRFLDGMPVQFQVARDRPGLNGVVVEVDDATGLARSIERVQRYGAPE